MAEIQIVYREGYCDYNCSKFCGQCYTGAAEDNGCKYYHGGCAIEVNGQKVIPYGDCTRARFRYIHKGGCWKNYEMEEVTDEYNPHLDSMLVTLGRTTYDCVKVKLDGKVIYNNYDDGGEKDAAE